MCISITRRAISQSTFGRKSFEHWSIVGYSGKGWNRISGSRWRLWGYLGGLGGEGYLSIPDRLGTRLTFIDVCYFQVRYILPYHMLRPSSMTLSAIMDVLDMLHRQILPGIGVKGKTHM